jgi:hypothetical protein
MRGLITFDALSISFLLSIRCGSSSFLRTISPAPSDQMYGSNHPSRPDDLFSSFQSATYLFTRRSHAIYHQCIVR